MKILKLFIYGAIFRKYPSVQNRSDIKNRNELFQFYKMNKDNTWFVLMIDFKHY